MWKQQLGTVNLNELVPEHTKRLLENILSGMSVDANRETYQGATKDRGHEPAKTSAAVDDMSPPPSVQCLENPDKSRKVLVVQASGATAKEVTAGYVDDHHVRVDWTISKGYLTWLLGQDAGKVETSVVLNIAGYTLETLYVERGQIILMLTEKVASSRTIIVGKGQD